MKKLIIISLYYLSNLLQSTEFNTDMGTCNLIFDDQKSYNENEKINLIKLNIKSLVYNYGIVNNLPFNIYITNNISKFEKLIKGTIPEWGIGIAQKNPDQIVIKGTQLSKISYSELNKVLMHEINHIYVQRSLNYDILPKWFIEGFASYWADELTITKKIQVSSALWEKREFSLQELKNFTSFNKLHANLAYAQSTIAINTLMYYYGKNIIKSILHNNLNFNNFDSLFFNITNENTIHLRTKYETYLNQNFKWIFLLKSSNFLFIIMPIILIFGYFIKQSKNKEILKKWASEEKLEYSDNE